ncbi:TPA: hypothetical protein SCV07_000699 [Campylobacter lari]|nr:hypothetical protein [Campylobacter lari]
MMEYIKRFIDRCKDNKNFKYNEYDFSKYSGELSQICEMKEKKDLYGIVNFYKSFENKKYFEVYHPINNNILTRAIYSYKDCVIFIDKSNKYIWAAFQARGIFDYFIVDDIIYGTPNAHSNYNVFLNTIKEIPYTKCLFDDISFGYSINNKHPWHFFYDILQYFLILNTNKFINSTEAFYIPPGCQYTNEKIVYLPLKVISIHKVIGTTQNIQILTNMSDKIFKQFNSTNDSDNQYELTLFISFVYRKNIKTWVNQVEAIAQLIKMLNKKYKNIRVFLDSVKTLNNKQKTDTGHETNEYINTFLNYFANQKYNNIKIKILQGMTYKEAALYCLQSDLCIVESGSGGILPIILCKKPTILYGNLAYLDLAKMYKNSNLTEINIVKKEFVKLVSKAYNSWDWGGERNYYIPWQHIYNLTAELLEQLSLNGKLKIKNLKIHRLEIPPVELAAKQYELEQKLQVKLPIESVSLYSDLQTTITILTNEKQSLIDDKINLQNQLAQFQNTLNFLPIKKQQFEISNLEQDLINKKLQTIQLEKKLDIASNNKTISSRNKIVISNQKSAKFRIQNQLSYKLGQAMIVNSKSILGYIRMPFVLSYIKDKHNQEQKIYQEKIKKDPSLALPPLESYPDYKEALKEKECLTYKLGQALIQANKTWYGGGVYQVAV